MPKDFYTYMECFKQSFTNTLNTTVEAAVANLYEKQCAIVKSVNTIGEQVTSVESDHAQTKNVVFTLRDEVNRQDLHRRTSSQSGSEMSLVRSFPHLEILLQITRTFLIKM